jgi:hypothetical protein
MRPEPDLEERLRVGLRDRANTFDLGHPDEPPDHLAPSRQRRSYRWPVVGVAAAVLALGGISLGGIGHHPVTPRIQAAKSSRGASRSSTTPGPPLRTGTGTARSEAPPPTPAPCPDGVTTPTVVGGQYCGPVPPAGNGLGPGGVCTGNETTAPCGAGITVGRYYAYTMPGTCDGLIIFDGKRWVSELPPVYPVPDFDVWLALGTDGVLRFIGPLGQVSFTPYTGQSLNQCSTAGPPPTP